MNSKKLVIVDISNFIFRAFFAIRPLNAPDGTPVNAVYGVLNMLLKLVEQFPDSDFVIAQDSPGPSFRKDIYDDYKANRTEPPEELIPQFGLINELLEVMKLPKVRLEKFEADDLIGTLVHRMRDQFEEVLIASSDKDLMQLVCEKVRMYDSMKDRYFGPREVEDKLGVRPEKVIDYLALVGDTSDNVPGVKGIGAKGAAKLLDEHGTLEAIFENKASVKNKRAFNALENHQEDGELSKKLVTIELDAPISVAKEDLKFELNPGVELKNFLQRLGFRSIEKKLFEDGGLTRKSTSNPAPMNSIAPGAPDGSKAHSDEDPENSFWAGQDPQHYQKVVFFDEQLDLFLKQIKKLESIALDIYNNELFFRTQNIAFAYQSESIERICEIAKILADKSKKIISWNPKKLQQLGLGHEIEDVRLLLFHGLQKTRIEPIKTILEQFHVDLSSHKKSEDIICYWGNYFAIELYEQIYPSFAKSSDFKVYADMDLPLNPILANMEREGVYLNCDYLKELEAELEAELAKIKKSIYEATEMDVNLNSPKQVGVLLFEKMGLPIIKSNKTGPSTDSSVLEKLESMGHGPIPGFILRFREIDKLLSTYVKSLPSLVDENSRIHTTFNQHVAATGRLSSDSPNLQNIPVRTREGKLVRKAFEAKKGYHFVSADYSQVELRILAHWSQDPTMVSAFQNDRDIHQETASEIFGIARDKVTSEQRSSAKAINFGLLYGQSSFGLSQTLNIPRNEAQQYIEFYFTKFGSVKAFLDELVEKCEKTGHAETLYGRRRTIPEIKSKNRNLKSMGERMAINTPVQGSAADITKLAMIKLDKVLREQFPQAKMLLQVHDEIICEAPKEQAHELAKVMKKIMSEAVDLSIPLKVDAAVGPNWFDLEDI